MLALGASYQETESLKTLRQPVEVHSDNVDAFRIFIRLDSQWKVIAMNTMSEARIIRTGLDYGAAHIVAQGLDIEWTGSVLDDLRVMEAEALRVFEKEAQRSARRTS